MRGLNSTMLSPLGPRLRLVRGAAAAIANSKPETEDGLTFEKLREAKRLLENMEEYPMIETVYPGWIQEAAI